jgi:hypothetical protein
MEAVKMVFASMWNEIAFSLRVENNISDDAVMPAVVIQAPVKAKFAGTMYTANTVSYNRNEIEVVASQGQGESVVNGKGAAATAIISKILPANRGLTIIRESSSVDIEYNFVDGRIEPRFVTPEEKRDAIFTPAFVRRIKALGEQIEDIYGFRPQDIEWCRDENGEIWIVQARPMRLNYLPAEKMVDDEEVRMGPLMDEETLNEMAQAARSPEKRESVDTLLKHLYADTKYVTFFSEDNKKYAEKIAAASYLSLLSSNRRFAKNIRIEDVTTVINIFKNDAKMLLDATNAQELLTFLRGVGVVHRNRVVRDAVKDFFVKYLARTDTSVALHTTNNTIALALIDYEEYDLALTKLREAGSITDENPDIGGQTIRVLSRIPTRKSVEALTAIKSKKSLPGWLGEFAMRVIDRIEGRLVVEDEPVSAGAGVGTVASALGTGIDRVMPLIMITLVGIGLVNALSSGINPMEWLTAGAILGTVVTSRNQSGKYAPVSCVVGVKLLSHANHGRVIGSVMNAVAGRNVKVIAVASEDQLAAAAKDAGAPGVLIDMTGAVDVPESEYIKTETVIGMVDAAIEQSALYKEALTQLEYERLMARIASPVATNSVSELREILDELKPVLARIKAYSIEQLAEDMARADYAALAAQREPTLTRVREIRKAVVSDQSLSMPLSDTVEEFAFATSDNVLASDMAGIDKMKQASGKIKNCVIYGSRFKSADDVKAYLKQGGYSDADMGNITFIDRRGADGEELSYAELLNNISSATGISDLSRIGIRAAAVDRMLGAGEKAIDGRFFEVPAVKIGDMNVIAAFNSYERGVNTLIRLSGVRNIAASDLDQIPGVYYDSVSGILRLKPIVPSNFAEMFRAYTDAMEALSTAA